MKNYKSIRLSNPAKKDLQTIANYTQGVWGAIQKRKYLALINQSLKQLNQVGNIGRKRDDISNGLYCLPVQKHSLFYRESAKEFIVIRILHSQMDTKRHLGS